MTDRTIDLDEHRGMVAQKATELRRLRVGVQADQAALKARQDALEKMLLALPAPAGPKPSRKRAISSTCSPRPRRARTCAGNG